MYKTPLLYMYDTSLICVRYPSYIYKVPSLYAYDTFPQLLEAFNNCLWSSTIVGLHQIQQKSHEDFGALYCGLGIGRFDES